MPEFQNKNTEKSCDSCEIPFGFAEGEVVSLVGFEQRFFKSENKMTAKKLLVALDSNALTGLTQGTNLEGLNYKEKQERLALLSLSAHFKSSSPFLIAPTVQWEYEKIGEVEKRELHTAYHYEHCSDLQLTGSRVEIDIRSAELQKFHNKAADCKFVAECEFGGVSIIITFDEDMKKRLWKQTKVNLVGAVELLRFLRVEDGLSSNFTIMLGSAK